ncbi:uncharacterized protein LOC123198117 isoform X1 [Mangifera indica]|uniref:uncharacterized protein LOC123198117 isoform X1 n=2 Tax=Mangifera indica TaxID=29780 RepID=UPI001CFAD96B|nr:uncharacterized protein LOC123198117 isoform X1 [Mangifera indica]XP_044468663.1 uncharacterized protein LOC123198117 isoform X1 [Mangifera indica]
MERGDTLKVSGEENNKIRDFDDDIVEVDSEPNNSDDKEDEPRVESMQLNECNAGTEEGQFIEYREQDKDFLDDSSILQVNVELTAAVELAEKIVESGSTVHVQNGLLNSPNENPIRKYVMDVSSMSGVKRARMTFEEDQPSVHVSYNSLTRAGKQKLEELLQQWSEWQGQHGSSLNDSSGSLESGDATYFPAIHVGKKEGSAVSFWIDNETRNQQNDGFIPLVSNNAPLYDRGYALGLTLEDDSNNVEGGLKIIDDASRCFNCGSYSHSLKECPKPRDNAAVNNARQQQKSRRNQNSASRNPTRYYQKSSGGKYDGLRPGALDVETRRLLGLGELDPPPWLNRMRELGYPPGYLDPDEEDQPSGITIFADEEIKEEQEDGEILEADTLEPQKKMTVKFPGINAPIPENADERLWAAAPSNSDPPRERTHHRVGHHTESFSRGHHYDQRWSRDYRDDGPPGCDPVSSYPPRYGGHDFGYHSHSRSPTLGRTHSERGMRSPLVYDDYMTDSSYRRKSPREHRLGRYENDLDRYRDDYDLGHSSRSIVDYDRYRRDDYDRYHHRSR